MLEKTAEDVRNVCSDVTQETLSSNKDTLRKAVVLDSDKTERNKVNSGQEDHENNVAGWDADKHIELSECEENQENITKSKSKQNKRSVRILNKSK